MPTPPTVTLRRGSARAAVVMPRLDFRSGDPLGEAARLLERHAVCGFIVFGGDGCSVAEAVRTLSSLAARELLFAVDAERGVGQTVDGCAVLPSAMSLGAARSKRLARAQAEITAGEMCALGLNVLFAPVLDLNTCPANPIINTRSFGDDPRLAGALGAAYVEGAQRAGVAATAKHFPGHGAVASDSHAELPVDPRGREEIETLDVVPFGEAVRCGVDAVMTAHVAYPALDPSGAPATVSRPVVGGVLRGGLSFGGLVFTDSFRMEGIAAMGDEVELARRALEAGCDVILDPADPAGLCRRLEELCAGDAALERSVRAAALRIAGLLQRLASRRLTRARAAELDVPSVRELWREVASRSVCRIKWGGPVGGRVAVCVEDTRGRAAEEAAAPLARALRGKGVECSVLPLRRLDPSSPALASCDLVCAVFTGVGAGGDLTCLDEEARTLLERAPRSTAASCTIVSFGSPYVLKGLEGFDNMVAAFDGADAVQEAAASVLLGLAESRGVMPVALSPV